MEGELPMARWDVREHTIRTQCSIMRNFAPPVDMCAPISPFPGKAAVRAVQGSTPSPQARFTASVTWRPHFYNGKGHRLSTAPIALLEYFCSKPGHEARCTLQARRVWGPNASASQVVGAAQSNHPLLPIVPTGTTFTAQKSRTAAGQPTTSIRAARRALDRPVGECRRKTHT